MAFLYVFGHLCHDVLCILHAYIGDASSLWCFFNTCPCYLSVYIYIYIYREREREREREHAAEERVKKCKPTSILNIQ